jgi:hypothetical protein
MPGAPEEIIQVSLHHRSLSSWLTYDALSYEWGESVCQHLILCEGRTLKATTSLLTLLKRLHSPGEARMLWVDAIWINQDDLVERAEQVPLMRDIYQNAQQALMWLGEEGPYTREAI